MPDKKRYCQIGWRLKSNQRELIRNKGFYIYSTRSWDEGCGCTLEHKVIVNHESDVITNWPALDENNREDMKNDFYEYMDECNAEDDYDYFKQELGEILEW